MEERNSPQDKFEVIDQSQRSFQYETDEEKNKKKAKKKRIFLGIMILCLPLLFSFIFITLNKRHSIHYPILDQVQDNPFIYQHMNGTLAFLNTEGNIKVFDNRMNKLQYVTEYVLKQENSLFLIDNWKNQIIINSQDAARVQWTYTNEVLNLYQIESISYLDENDIINNCSPDKSFALSQDAYLLTCDQSLFLYYQDLQIQDVEFENYQGVGVVLAKQSPIMNIFNIIYTNKSQNNNDLILYIYEFDLRDKDTNYKPKLIYQGLQQQANTLKDMIILTDYIVMIFPQHIANYKKIASTEQDQKFSLELVDGEQLNILYSNLKECLQVGPNIICYDTNSNNLIKISQWNIKQRLQLNKDLRVIRINKGEKDDLFILTQIQMMRITLSPFEISEIYIFKANGLSDEISDLMVIKS